MLGAARSAARKRAVRPRARRVHRRAPAEARAVRDGRRRHRVSRRDRRDGARAAGEAAAVSRGEDLQARGRGGRHPRRRPRRRRDEPKPRRRGEARQVPRGSVLSAERAADCAAAAARARRRHSAARALFHRHLQHRVPQARAARRTRDDEAAAGIRLAGQHPRAAQRHRARDAAGRRRRADR